MRNFHFVAALYGDGLRPDLQALFEHLAIDPYSELFVRPDGLPQSGPDPKSPTKMDLKKETIPNGASAGDRFNADDARAPPQSLDANCSLRLDSLVWPASFR